MQFFLTILILVQVINVFSQSPVSAANKITYTFLHMRDTTNPTKFYEEEMMLYFDKSGSVYKSYTKIKSDSALKTQFEQAVKEQGNEHVNLGRISLKGIRDELFHFLSEKKIIVILPFRGINYAITSSVGTINWIIKDSTRQIGNFTCQLAVGFYMGREYRAWFCPDLPSEFGPWKLHGLPGAILEAMDTKMQVQFKFQSFESVEIVAITLPEKTIETTSENYKKMRKAYSEQMAINTDNDEGVSFSIKKVSNYQRKKTVFNNPIELSEK